MSPLKQLLGVTLALSLIGLASAQDEVTVTHAQGETTVPVNPEVVLSFDYASIDTLQALGVTVDGMPPLELSGETSYAGEDTLNIGSLFEPDYEAVNAAEPDLIIVAARSAEAYAELSQIAPTIDLTFSDDADMVDELKRVSGILGQIFDKEAEVQAALDEIDAKVASVGTAVANGGDGLVILTSGGSVNVLAAEGERAGRGSLLYNTLGLEPAVTDITAATHGEPVSFEFLLTNNPDRLFVIDRDAATGESEGQPAEAVLDNALVHETTAWQEDQITYLTPFDWYIITGAGLDSMNRMLDEVQVAYAE